MQPEQELKVGKLGHLDDGPDLSRAHREPGSAPLNPALWR